MSTQPMSDMGAVGDEQPDATQDSFSPQVRYAGPEVTCSACEYFDGKSQCSNQKKIADGGPNVDPGGRCEEFEASGEDQAPDELKATIQDSKNPFTEATGNWGR